MAIPVLRALRVAILGLSVAFVATGCSPEKPKPVVKVGAKAPAASPERTEARRAAPATAAVPATPPPRLADGSYRYAGLHYIELVTGGASPNEKLPMVVMFHGRGGNPRQYVNRFANFPQKARFILPYGESTGGGHYAWFPARSGRPENHTRFATVMPSTTARIAASLDAIARKRPTSGKPVVAGFSQGAHMAYGLALLQPNSIGASFPVAGLVPQQLLRSSHSTTKNLPEVHAFHGDQDRTYRDGSRTVNELRRLGYVSDLRTYRGVGHKFDAAAPDLQRGLERAVRRQAGAPSAPSRNAPPKPRSRHPYPPTYAAAAI